MNLNRQTPLSIVFSRQEYWSGLLFPPPRDLPEPGFKPSSPAPPALQVDSLPLSHQEAHLSIYFIEVYDLEIYQKNRTSRIHAYILYIYIYIYIYNWLISRNWLMQLWGLVWQVQYPWSRPVTWNFLGSSLHFSLQEEFLLPQGNLSFLIKSFK